MGLKRVPPDPGNNRTHLVTTFTEALAIVKLWEGRMIPYRLTASPGVGYVLEAWPKDVSSIHDRKKG